MRSNKGITLTSLIIYVIGLTIVIALMGTFNGYFYRNVKTLTIKQNVDEDYSKFLSYITKDVNSDNVENVASGIDGKDCVIFKFKDGKQHQYIVQNNILYYINVENQNEKKIVMWDNVAMSANNVFSYSDGKIDINLTIEDTNISKELNVKM